MADATYDFDLTKKKKKKKTPKAEDEEGEEAVEEVTAEVAELKVGDDTAALGEFAGKKKKKKKPALEEEEEEEKPKPKKAEPKKKEADEDEDEEEEEHDDEDDETIDEAGITFEDTETNGGGMTEAERRARQLPADPTADYPYQFLLARLVDYLRANNPELGGERKRFSMKPPQVVREGTKKIVWINFPEICQTMHRSLDHVLMYLLAELGTSGSLDGNQRLVIKGRFNPKQIENVLRRYITEFVLCQMCKSFDTTLTRDNVSRLFFLKCESCNSTRSVAAIKQGFLAQVGKRKKQP